MILFLGLFLFVFGFLSSAEFRWTIVVFVLIGFGLYWFFDPADFIHDARQWIFDINWYWGLHLPMPHPYVAPPPPPPFDNP